METQAAYRRTVYPWQCDHVGHMNIMRQARKSVPFVETIRRTAAKLLVFPEAVSG
jgi:hypothetical protein